MLQMLRIYVPIALLLLLALSLASNADSVPGSYTREDLLVTFPTHLGNAPLIEASRAWRRGVRTHIIIPPGLDPHSLRTLGSHHRETFTVLPDFPGHPNTIRHALTPIFALEAAGRNRAWMLVGDDDTIFSIPAVLRLLNSANLSADDPHILTDYLYTCSNPAHTDAWDKIRADDPRCLPCPPQHAVRPCACRLPPECRQSDPWGFANCSALPARLLPYGGAGIIFSIGMLRLLTGAPSYFPLAFQGVTWREPWGDRVLAEAPRFLGLGFTRLGDYALNHTDPSKIRPFFGTFSLFNDERSLERMLADLRAAAEREPELLRRSVSFHARARLHERYWGLSGDAQLQAYRRIVDMFLRVHGEP